MEYTKVKLGDILTSISETISKEQQTAIFLNTSDISEGKFLHKRSSVVKELPGQAKKKIKNGDILFSEIRPKNKRYAVVDVSNPNDYVVSTKLMVLRIKDPSKYYLQYIYQQLISQKMLHQINEIAESRSGTFPQITFDAIKNIELTPPPLEEQKRIADIFTVLDDKIELNNQMNQTLEEIASLLYKRWFVDFEFPDDKGKPYKSSGGEMVDSELGMIPKRWEVKELGEICVNSDSKRKPLSKNQRERLSGDYPYYGATSIIDYVNDYIFDGTYLLVGEDGTVVTKDGKPILQYITGKIWVNNHAHVLQGKDVSTGFLFCKLSQFDVTHLVTGAVQMKITQSNLNKIKFVISESNIQKRFEKIITLLFNKRNENKIYNEALKKIKKELVIKLI